MKEQTAPVLTPIDTREIAFLVAILNRVVKKAIELFAGRETWRGRTGCGFTLADAETGLRLFFCYTGAVLVEKASKYFELSGEKAARLSEHLPDGHRTSSESKNNDQGKYGGAIMATLEVAGRKRIFSCSGFPELEPDFGDTVVMLVVAVASANMTFTQAMETALLIGAEAPFSELYEAIRTDNR